MLPAGCSPLPPHCLPVPTGPLPKPFCRPTAAYHWPAADPVHLWSILQLLVLLMLANGTPVVAKKFLGERFTYPLDGGVVFCRRSAALWPVEDDPWGGARGAGDDGGRTNDRPRMGDRGTRWHLCYGW